MATFTDEAATRENWDHIRRLERDIEDAMVRYNRGNDGLGYAAVAFLLREKGWVHAGGDQMLVRGPTRRYRATISVDDLRAKGMPIIEKAISPWPEITFEMILAKSPAAAQDNRVVARRAAYRALFEAGWSTLLIAHALSRSHSTIYHAVHQRPADT